MRVIGYIITACVALAILQAMASILVLVLLVGTLYALVTRPRETVTVAVVVMFVGLTQSQPLAVLILLGMILLACIIGKLIEHHM